MLPRFSRPRSTLEMPSTQPSPRPPSSRPSTTGRRSLAQHFRPKEHMSSYSVTETTTFTVTHARHMASKLSADLKRMQRFYSYPTDSAIAQYETEVIELLKAGYFGTLTVGFLRNGQWIEPTLRYTSRDLAGMAVNDDDPGRVLPG